MTADRSRPRLLLAVLVALAILLGTAVALAPAAAASAAPTPARSPAQDDASVDDAEGGVECAPFTKPDAIEHNDGEPLGNAIWGRLCQEIDGEARYPEGVEITVSQDGEDVGSDTTADDGVFLIPIPGNGRYQVTIDIETLPDEFALTTADRATESPNVQLGDQQVSFRLGEDTRGQKDFSDYATGVAKGLRLGLILAVAAIGLSLVYGVTGLVNFSHAELVTFGAVVAYGLNAAGIPFWLTLPPAVLAGAAMGWANDRVVWRPLRDRKMALLSMMVVSIGLSIAARNVIQVVFGPTGKRYDLGGIQTETEVGPIRLTPNDWIIMAICVVVLVAMTLLLRRTRLGTAIRAVADNPDLAESSGIAVARIVTVVWILCGGLAALGGILYGLTINVKFDMGFILLLSMFAAIVLGGLGNAYGAVLGALVIGVVQETAGMFVDTAYKFVVALLVLIVVLLIRPQGILGQRERLG